MAPLNGSIHAINPSSDTRCNRLAYKRVEVTASTGSTVIQTNMDADGSAVVSIYRKVGNQSLRLGELALGPELDGPALHASLVTPYAAVSMHAVSGG